MIVHPSTLAPVLIALGATAEVAGPKGTRTVALDTFYQAPVKDTQREHTLAPNEVLVSVKVAPKVPAGAALRNASYEVKQRETCEWPLVQAAVAFHTERGSTLARGVRVVLGHVAPTPLVSES
ncbi:MAG: FAD binding domain-containing protein, partial [Planctomycetes bacterium]|nr:FAD binding domain-containing protein [Planctomycetota bacterium]